MAFFVSNLPVVTTNISLSSLEVYDSGIIRSAFEPIELPYSCEDLSICENEYAISTNINDTIIKLNENFEYLNTQTRIYNSRIPLNEDTVYGFNFSKSNITDIASVDQTTWVIAENSLISLSGNSTISFIQTLSSSQVDEFFRLTSLEIDSSYNLFLLDGNLVHRYDVSNPSTPEYVSFIGGFGGSSANYRFNNPNDMHIDLYDRLYINDYGNNVLKIFANDFQHIETIAGQFQSITTDSSKIFALNRNGDIAVFDINSYQRLSTITTNSPNPRRIYHDKVQNGFIYVVFDTSIRKYTIDGLLIGTFETPNTQNSFTGITKYENDNYLYISDETNLYKVLDYSFTFTIKDDTKDFPHDLSCILVEPQELQTDYIYNDSFGKLKENFNCLVESITGQFVNVVSEFQDEFVSNNILALSSTITEYCSCDCNLKIGQNEIFSSNVLNRPITYLCNCLNDIKINFIDSQNIALDPTSGINCEWNSFSCGDGGPRRINCNSNPYSWKELTSECKVLSGVTWQTLETQARPDFICNFFKERFQVCRERIIGQRYRYFLKILDSSFPFDFPQDYKFYFWIGDDDQCPTSNQVICDFKYGTECLNEFIVTIDPLNPPLVKWLVIDPTYKFWSYNCKATPLT